MTIGHVLGGPTRYRPVIAMLGLAAVVVPVFLGETNILDLGGFYGTPEQTIAIVRPALALWQGSLYIALVVGATWTLLISTLLATTYRDVLESMEAMNRARVHALARLLQPK
jgi:hypothetical protein